ncbi:cytochrome c oxidase subunit 3 [Rhodococcus sp. IEGM 1305]|uniref:Cytochrome aa3 subunit 3 n=1 Tax=Rhodococcus opacus TaxID=37919 RepID=A0A2S8J681_RHOOP|nr:MULTISPECIES: cytochrome c oxidase subunit 3 [Rhodococcus]MDI9947717.1 cytochrome c oxidase subunit 3 [Rhodococcus sp. IEGM 1305]PQP22580.1 cytochrome C oxidase subunit III [Rhodococcus opacus]
MSTVTRNSRQHPRAVPQVPGEVGIWVFIFGDMVIFAVLFATFFYYRAKKPEIFDQSQVALNQNYGAANTVVLLVSSLLVVLAVRAVRKRMPLAPHLIAGAIFCGILFSALKVLEYAEKVSHGITPATNDFFMFYFVLTGLHWFHLIVGLVVLVTLYVFARKPEITEHRFAFFEGGACFWHMVDLLWIVLFPMLYLVR